MTASPDAVLLYVPLMKETNMTWEEIKRTPRYELAGLLAACHEYRVLHSMDGYNADDIGRLAKDKPRIRSDWNKYQETRRKYEDLIGKKSNENDMALQSLKTQVVGLR